MLTAEFIHLLGSVLPVQTEEIVSGHKFICGYKVSGSRMGGKAFHLQAPLMRGQLLISAHEADALSAFKIRIKTSSK